MTENKPSSPDSGASNAGKALETAASTNNDGMFKQGKEGVVNSHINPEKTAELAKHREALKAEGLSNDEKIKIQGDIDRVRKKITPEKTAAFEKMAPTEKIKASAGGNFGKNAGAMGKVGRGAVSLGGLIVLGSGVKNLVAPERDEQGERQGSAWKQVGKIGAGAAATYLAVVSKGGVKAMSIH